MDGVQVTRRRVDDDVVHVRALLQGGERVLGSSLVPAHRAVEPTTTVDLCCETSPVALEPSPCHRLTTRRDAGGSTAVASPCAKKTTFARSSADSARTEFFDSAVTRSAASPSAASAPAGARSPTSQRSVRDIAVPALEQSIWTALPSQSGQPVACTRANGSDGSRRRPSQRCRSAGGQPSEARRVTPPSSMPETALTRARPGPHHGRPAGAER